MSEANAGSKPDWPVTTKQREVLSFFGESADGWRAATKKIDKLFRDAANRDRYQAEVARRYLMKMPPSVENNGGSAATFAAACLLVIDFDLPESTAWELLREYNHALCSPPWPEDGVTHSLRRKLEQALEKRGRVGGDKIGCKGIKFDTSKPARGRGSNQSSHSSFSNSQVARPVWIDAPEPAKSSGKVGILEEKTGVGAEFSIEMGCEEPEKIEEMPEKIEEEAEKVDVEPKKKAVPMENLLRIWGSKEGFWKNFVENVKIFWRENAVHPNVLYLDATVAAELPVLFPPSHPEVCVRSVESTGYFAFSFEESAEIEDPERYGLPSGRRCWTIEIEANPGDSGGSVLYTPHSHLPVCVRGRARVENNLPNLTDNA